MANDEDRPESAAAGWRDRTLVTHAGLDPHAYHGFVNPPVVRASTVLFPDSGTMESRRGTRYSYGLTNTPTIEALNKALSALDRAAGTVLVPSGLAAVTLAILVAVRPGAVILVPDNVYGPTRRFCDESLPALGATARYYDPLVGAGIAEMMEGVTGLFIEAPGSLTFEMPDIPAFVEAARRAGVTTMMDNTWATPLLYRPLDHGIDIALYAGTKYLGGHSDLLIGSVSANAATFPALNRLHRNLGIQAGPDEIWLALRGLRTMAVRLDRHEAQALEIARWLASRPEVKRVLHPALPDDPGHAIWKRDFGRSTGLFSFVLDGSHEHAGRFLDALQLFGLGYSWGGFESLIMPAAIDHLRTAWPWQGGPLVRLHCGLADASDLIADLDEGFAAMAKALG